MAPMDRRVDVIGHGAHRATAGMHGAVEIDDEQVARRDLLEQQPARVHQEAVAAPWHHQAEMVADPDIEPEPRGEAEGGGEIAPRFHLATNSSIPGSPPAAMRACASTCTAPAIPTAFCGRNSSNRNATTPSR
jgi:hypothetical protein